MVNRFRVFDLKEFFFFIDKQQSPGALARSSSANELALRKKNHLTTPNVQSTIGKYSIIYSIRKKENISFRSTTISCSISCCCDDHQCQNIIS
jgi:hypothetical protein